MLHIGMKPGAVIPAHLHKGMAEALYIVEGDFMNEGKQYQAGTSLHFKAGKVHGPHTTKNESKLLVLWTERSSKESADLSDFTLATQRAAYGQPRGARANMRQSWLRSRPTWGRRSVSKRQRRSLLVLTR